MWKHSLHPKNTTCYLTKDKGKQLKGMTKNHIAKKGSERRKKRKLNAYKLLQFLIFKPPFYCRITNQPLPRTVVMPQPKKIVIDTTTMWHKTVRSSRSVRVVDVFPGKVKKLGHDTEYHYYCLKKCVTPGRGINVAP